MSGSLIFGAYADTIPPSVHRGWELTVFMTGDWYDYALGYIQAGAALIEQLDKQDPCLDRQYVVFPVVFCYRQYIELTLKHLIVGASFVLGTEPCLKDFNHDLSKLWDKASTHLKAIPVQESPAEFDNVTSVIKEFSKHDPGSFGFRYPTDKQGTPLLRDLVTVNLLDLYEVMEKLFDSFDRIIKELSLHIGSRRAELEGPPDDWYWDQDALPGEPDEREHP